VPAKSLKEQGAKVVAKTVNIVKGDVAIDPFFCKYHDSDLVWI
jgi:hypothetical protein